MTINPFHPSGSRLACSYLFDRTAHISEVIPLYCREFFHRKIYRCVNKTSEVRTGLHIHNPPFRVSLIIVMGNVKFKGKNRTRIKGPVPYFSVPILFWIREQGLMWKSSPASSGPAPGFPQSGPV